MKVPREPLLWQVKSRLLPLSPVGRALEWLVECLPRRLMRVQLESRDDIEVINEGKGEYKSTSDTPSFEMRLSPAPARGWYYLEAALSRNNGSREASIRVTILGEGSETLVIPIPTNLRGTVREVFFLPHNVESLYWSPTAAKGFFSQSQLLLHKISPLESFFRRMVRVIFDLWRFRNRTPEIRAGLSWWGAGIDLQDAYQRTATLRMKRLIGNDYAAFIALHDTLKKTDVKTMRKQVHHLSISPVISLIMPVQAPIEAFFTEALDSVCGQIYPHWELLLVGNFSTDSQNLAIVNEYQSKNIKVEIVSVDAGTELAVTLNRALEIARGEFVAKIDQHDQIPSHALFFLAQEISRYPDADLIYSDSDSIDQTNTRLDPHFKPDWNLDLFYSNNYLANLTLYRRARVLELGGYRAGFDGAEGYDLSLRYLRDVQASKIRHIPRVLYHSRITGQTLASTPSHHKGVGRGEEGRVQQSGKRALEAYFEGSGVTVEDGAAPNLYRIKHPLPPKQPLVTIIIPTRDMVQILEKCIESIQQKTDYENWEMLIVDNQSVNAETLVYFERIQLDARIKVIRYEKPFNYSAINNYAVQFARGEILALLNNDVEVLAKDWLTEMVSHAIRPGIGAVGAKLLYSNGVVQHAGVILGIGGVAGHAHKFMAGDDHGYCHRASTAQNFSAVTGACLVVKKNIYEEVGGLNEVSLKVALNDIDFCLKLRLAGFRNLFTPYAQLYHHESISRGRDDTPEKHELLAREIKYMKDVWGVQLQNDPAYNPNLTLEFENFSLRYV